MSITAVINLYKRPYTLIQQLSAIKNQSVKPENIIIWKNTVEGIELPKIPDELNNNIIIIDCSKNLGVWPRFYAGLFCNSKYICVFDDDTIPGCDWFKNCLNTMETHRGLLGTIGLRFIKGNDYIHEFPRMGWEGANENTEQVDIVGHSWFFEREWITELTKFEPDYSSMLSWGEDICFSYCLQQIGINTYVPPHPRSNMNLWGSHPKLALQYGADNNAISYLPGSVTKFDNFLKLFIEKGFKTMNNKIKLNYNLECIGNYYIPNDVKNGIAVDIGGNTGYFSLTYKEYFKKIYLYEAQRECYSICVNRLKEYENINIYNEAVSNTSNNYVNLLKHKSDDSGSVCVFNSNLEEKEWTDIIVDSNIKTISLEDILYRCGGYIDYLKIDCETSEYDILINKKLDNIKYIAIEIHWQIGKKQWDELLGYILTYFDIVINNDISYGNSNKEYLFKHK